jgi:hypothetical protein
LETKSLIKMVLVKIASSPLISCARFDEIKLDLPTTPAKLPIQTSTVRQIWNFTGSAAYQTARVSWNITKLVYSGTAYAVTNTAKATGAAASLTANWSKIAYSGTASGLSCAWDWSKPLLSATARGVASVSVSTAKGTVQVAKVIGSSTWSATKHVVNAVGNADQGTKAIVVASIHIVLGCFGLGTSWDTLAKALVAKTIYDHKGSSKAVEEV